MLLYSNSNKLTELLCQTSKASSSRRWLIRVLQTTSSTIRKGPACGHVHRKDAWMIWNLCCTNEGEDSCCRFYRINIRPWSLHHLEPAKKHLYACAVSKYLLHIQLLTDSHKKPSSVMKRFPFYQRRPSFLGQGEETWRFPTNLHRVECSARPTIRWTLSHQRRTAWWATHGKDTANNHLLQTRLY